MKKVICMLTVLLAALMIGGALAEDAAIMAADAPVIPDTPFDWGQLATIAGATMATLLIVQLLKLPLDRIWKIPTRIVVYVIALIIMIAATYFTGGLTLEKVGLAAVNAVIVALAAMGSYELTFAKLDAKKH